MRDNVKVDNRGKIQIPDEFRKEMGIELGQKLIIETKNDMMVIREQEEEDPDLHELAKKLNG
ncbi:MAG: AbrB/MazE/SpoVT family DNA-binding domain-containing protein [Thermoplasmatota archaeon]